MGRLSRAWYIGDMKHAPITAPIPSVPSPWYALQQVTLVKPDGDEVVWGILREESQGLLNWFAKSKACAIAHVKYLNGITTESPTCTCQN